MKALAAGDDLVLFCERKSMPRLADAVLTHSSRSALEYEEKCLG